jgi:regulator of protease activity HflC (stomatin/prohibitin superfamily)
MDQFIGSMLFSLIVVGLMVGVWAWLLVLFKKGPRALLGFERVIVQQFENVLLYKNGAYEKSLMPGAHWLRVGGRQVIRVDMRPEVYRLAQGAVSSDHCAINLLCIARTQITNPRASFESSKNYRDEIFVRLQSVLKAVCLQNSRLEIQTSHDDFNKAAQIAANLTLRDIGCECVGFEILQAEATGAVADLDEKRMGFGPH